MRRWSRSIFPVPSAEYNLNKCRTAKGRKREADYLRTSISAERHISEFCGFSFCPIYPDLEVKKLTTQKMPMGVKNSKRAQQKPASSLVNRPRQEQAGKIETVRQKKFISFLYTFNMIKFA